MADLDYASPRPPRKSDSAVISVWCTSLGIPPIVLLIVLRLFHVQVPLGFQAFVPAILLIALAAIGCGLVSSVQSIAQREPRWRTAAIAGSLCAATLAWVALGVVRG